MFKIKFLPLISAIGFAALLSGCGSGSFDDAVETPPPGRFGAEDGINFTGASGCVACHSDLRFGTFDPEISAQIVSAYLDSRHVQGNSRRSVNAGSSALCLSCHDPVRDGRTLEPFLPEGATIPAAGLAAVGCESCHGAGGEHFGVGALPRPTPDFNTCGSCHTALVPAGPHAGVGAFSRNILENYQDSRHASSVRGATSALCSSCHSDQGFRQHFEAAAGLGSNDLPAFFSGVAAPTEVSPIQCRTCHDPHSGDLRTAATLDEENRTVFSREFNLCTACHQVFLEATFDVESGTFSYQIDNARTTFMRVGHPTPGGSAAVLIEDTHFTNPADGIPGFNINAAAKNACTQCHDPHLASKFTGAEAQAIAEEWAFSGHADYQGEAFTANITQSACFKCHSGVEYVKLIGSTNATPDIGAGAQVVSCVACHDLTARDTAGSVALGALRPVQSVTFPSGAVVSLGGPSNLCMECHQGRSSTPTVDARIAAGNLSFSNIHFFPAAATLFGSEVRGGYEYAGRTYRGRNTFGAHPVLGFPELTTCTGCHMDSGTGHSFQVPIESCTACHPGTAFTNLAGSPQINFTHIEALKDQLLGLIVASGVEAIDGFPYFQNITNARQLRAAYNWQVASKEPCGYIHNGFYIRQLLHDSIVDMGGTPVFPRP